MRTTLNYYQLLINFPLSRWSVQPNGRCLLTSFSESFSKFLGLQKQNYPNGFCCTQLIPEKHVAASALMAALLVSGVVESLSVRIPLLNRRSNKITEVISVYRVECTNDIPVNLLVFTTEIDPSSKYYNSPYFEPICVKTRIYKPNIARIIASIENSSPDDPVTASRNERKYVSESDIAKFPTEQFIYVSEGMMGCSSSFSPNSPSPDSLGFFPVSLNY
mmetsp:Transcript_105698/g.158215  ORF Transcript_105698/g.158215 Transcript_105698/m.158215 type:complete len:219 (-) Transcript_105698:35-691(-)